MNRTVLVFGASGGIGSALCKTLSSNDDRVIGVARNEEKLLSLKNDGALTDYRVCDITQPQEVALLFQNLKEENVPFSGVAHCVGSITLKPIHILKDEDFAQSLQTNLWCVFYTLRASVKYWLGEKSSGRFVACSTAAASIGLPNHEAIAAAKSGLEGMLVSAAATYANKNIFINAVAPGLIDTPLSEKIVKSEPALAASLNMHAIKRVGRPEDVASAMEWLLDERQSWITGQVIKVDGGLSGLKTVAS